MDEQDIEDLHFGCKVRILTGEHAGKIAMVEAPSQNQYALMVTGEDDFHYYNAEDLELIFSRKRNERLQECPCGILKSVCDYHK